MLTQTFCHLSGIRGAGERKLWSSGILVWDDYARAVTRPFSESKDEKIRRQLVASREAFERGDMSFFLSSLAPAERVRVFPHVRGRTAYIDIETTGLSQDAEITTIVLYDGVSVKMYVLGDNLDDFCVDIAKYDMLVTYNGARFDLPFLRRAFGYAFDQPHLDLCPVLRAFGYRGGLKGCERQLGIQRQVPPEIDGRQAVLLWEQYERAGDLAALELLKAYNAQDVISLELLLTQAYDWSMSDHPLARPTPVPEQPILNVPIYSLDDHVL